MIFDHMLLTKIYPELFASIFNVEGYSSHFYVFWSINERFDEFLLVLHRFSDIFPENSQKVTKSMPSI